MPSAPADDAVRLVERQYETSAAIFAAAQPADALQALHRFLDSAFSRAQMALVSDEGGAVTARVVARLEGDLTFVVDEPAALRDVPAMESLLALSPVICGDVESDAALPAPERAALVARGVRALALLPLAVAGRLTALIVFEHDRRVDLSPAIIRALRHLSDQTAMVLEKRRLLEQSQAQVRRQAKVSQVAAGLMTATDVRSLLDLAALLVHDAMGAVSTRITLLPDPDSRGAGEGDAR
jgi:GAF domain-containing protein